MSDPATVTISTSRLDQLERIVKAAARHIRSFEPGSLQGSELALAVELVEAGELPLYFISGRQMPLRQLVRVWRGQPPLMRNAAR